MSNSQDIARVIMSENIDNIRGTKHFYRPHPYTDDLLKQVTKPQQRITLSQSGRLLASYMKYNNIMKDTIDSYEYFMDKHLQKLLNSYPLIFYNNNGTPFRKYEIIVSQIKLPQISGGNNISIPITPGYAHLTDRTMMNDVFCKVKEYEWNISKNDWIEVVYNDESGEIHEPELQLCSVPTIVRSKYCNTGGKTNRELYEMGECPSWPGGYVVSEGEIKNIVIKQKLRNNRFVIYSEKKIKYGSCSMICTAPQGTIKVTTFIPSDERPICIWLKFMGYKEENGIPKEINMFYTFSLIQHFAFPNQDDSLTNVIFDILKFIPNEEARQKGKILLDFALTTFQFEAKTPKIGIQQLSEMIGLPRGQTIENETILLKFIDESLFPQLNTMKVSNKGMDIMKYKYFQLCYMVAKYLEYTNGYREEDDRDSVSTNIFTTSGMNIYSLLNTIYQFLYNELNASYRSKPTSIEINSIYSWIGKINKTVSMTFETSLTNLSWGYKRSKSMNKSPGVERLVPSSITLQYSEMTKIVVPSSKKGKQPNVRENHQSQTGFIDFVDSPESEACGLTKRKALTCYLSQERDDDIIFSLIEDKIDSLLEEDEDMLSNSDILFINGKIVGLCNGKYLAEFLKDKRRSGTIPFDTLICHREKEVIISTDGGRATRPLLIVNPKTNNLIYFEKNLFDKPFEDIVKAKAVEFVDSLEQEQLFVCQSMDLFIKEKYLLQTPKKYTHCELDPNAIFSFASAEIPLANHNMGTKNCYSCNMMKQGLGTIGSNYENIFSTGTKMFDAPAEPIMDSQINIISGLGQLPTGRNITVCYMAYNGYNQEDAIILNEGSVNRGVFNYTVYYKYKFSFMVSGPNKMVLKELSDDDRKNPKYRNLDKNGIVKYGTVVNPGDILIRIEHKTNNNGIEDIQEKNVLVKYGESGIVYNIARIGNTIKIKLEDPRNILTGINFVGDKFSSRAATKGVASIVIPENEIPFTSTGIRPDIIINPLGVPTRAPMNKIIEFLSVKGNILKGKFINGTSFNNPVAQLERAQSYLEEYGYDNQGEEIMINPYTGERFPGTFYVGLVDYIMLNHHAIDKIQGQGKNIQREITTGQPIKGRKKKGGVRFGEWERDGQLGHSSSSLIYAIMCQASDKKSCIICQDCGSTSIFSIENKGECIQCKGNRLHLSTFGGGFNLFRSYMNGMGIRTILNLDDNENQN